MKVSDDQCREFALAYLDAAVRAGRGPITFVTTENGDIGVILYDDARDEKVKVHGSGDTAEDALIDAAYRGVFPDIALVAREEIDG